MPTGDPQPAVNSLLRAERRIRREGFVNIDRLDIDEYWRDLVRMLQVLRYFRDGNVGAIAQLKAAMASPVYAPLIDQKRDSATQNRRRSQEQALR
jgi:thymidylate synthase